MAEILPIRRKTLYNQLIWSKVDQSICNHKCTIISVKTNDGYNKSYENKEHFFYLLKIPIVIQ